MPWVERADAQAAGTLDATPFDPMTGTLDAPRQGQWVERGAAPMSNVTAVPKGGVPRQLNIDEANRAWAQLRMQSAMDAEKARPNDLGTAIENTYTSAQKELGNAYAAAPGALVDTITYPQRVINNLVAGNGLPNFSVAPKPSVDDVSAYVRSVMDGVPYEQARANVDIREGVRGNYRPVSTGLGTAIGDIASVVGPRAVIAPEVVAATKGPEAISAAQKVAQALKAGGVRQVMQMWLDAAPKAARRVATKAAETGLEGAAVNYLQDGDPIKGAIFGSSAQLGGSLALGLFKSPTRAAATIGSTIIGWSMLNKFIPGYQRGESLGGAYDHAIELLQIGVPLGLTAALMGAGRSRGSEGILGRSYWMGHQFAENAPRVAESIDAVLRTGPQSVFRQIFLDNGTKQPVIGPVLNKYSQNPDLFTRAEAERVARGIRNGNLRSTIQSMLQDQNFADRMAQ